MGKKEPRDLLEFTARGKAPKCYGQKMLVAEQRLVFSDGSIEKPSSGLICGRTTQPVRISVQEFRGRYGDATFNPADAFTAGHVVRDGKQLVHYYSDPLPVFV